MENQDLLASKSTANGGDESIIKDIDEEETSVIKAEEVRMEHGQGHNELVAPEAAFDRGAASENCVIDNSDSDTDVSSGHSLPILEPTMVDASSNTATVDSAQAMQIEDQNEKVVKEERAEERPLFVKRVARSDAEESVEKVATPSRGNSPVDSMDEAEIKLFGPKRGAARRDGVEPYEEVEMEPTVVKPIKVKIKVPPALREKQGKKEKDKNEQDETAEVEGASAAEDKEDEEDEQREEKDDKEVDEAPQPKKKRRSIKMDAEYRAAWEMVNGNNRRNASAIARAKVKEAAKESDETKGGRRVPAHMKFVAIRYEVDKTFYAEETSRIKYACRVPFDNLVVGTRVTLRWIDGLTYAARFVGFAPTEAECNALIESIDRKEKSQKAERERRAKSTLEEIEEAAEAEEARKARVLKELMDECDEAAERDEAGGAAKKPKKPRKKWTMKAVKEEIDSSESSEESESEEEEWTRKSDGKKGRKRKAGGASKKNITVKEEEPEEEPEPEIRKKPKKAKRKLAAETIEREEDNPFDGDPFAPMDMRGGDDETEMNQSMAMDEGHDGASGVRSESEDEEALRERRKRKKALQKEKKELARDALKVQKRNKKKEKEAERERKRRLSEARHNAAAREAEDEERRRILAKAKGEGEGDGEDGDSPVISPQTSFRIPKRERRDSEPADEVTVPKKVTVVKKVATVPKKKPTVAKKNTVAAGTNTTVLRDDEPAPSKVAKEEKDTVGKKKEEDTVAPGTNTTVLRDDAAEEATVFPKGDTALEKKATVAHQKKEDSVAPGTNTTVLRDDAAEEATVFHKDDTVFEKKATVAQKKEDTVALGTNTAVLREEEPEKKEEQKPPVLKSCLKHKAVTFVDHETAEAPVDTVREQATPPQKRVTVAGRRPEATVSRIDRQTAGGGAPVAAKPTSPKVSVMSAATAIANGLKKWEGENFGRRLRTADSTTPEPRLLAGSDASAEKEKGPASVSPPPLAAAGGLLAMVKRDPDEWSALPRLPVSSSGCADVITLSEDEEDEAERAARKAAEAAAKRREDERRREEYNERMHRRIEEEAEVMRAAREQMERASCAQHTIARHSRPDPRLQPRGGVTMNEAREAAAMAMPLPATHLAGLLGSSSGVAAAAVAAPPRPSAPCFTLPAVPIAHPMNGAETLSGYSSYRAGALPPPPQPYLAATATRVAAPPQPFLSAAAAAYPQPQQLQHSSAREDWASIEAAMLRAQSHLTTTIGITTPPLHASASLASAAHAPAPCPPFSAKLYDGAPHSNVGRGEAALGQSGLDYSWQYAHPAPAPSHHHHGQQQLLQPLQPALHHSQQQQRAQERQSGQHHHYHHHQHVHVQEHPQHHHLQQEPAAFSSHPPPPANYDEYDIDDVFGF